MDSVTHLVLGAAIGEAALGKKIGRKAMLWGALANTIPDFDVFAAPFFTDAQQLLVHRGITHSFLFTAMMSPLLGWLFSQWFIKSNVSWKSWTGFFFVEMLSHILLDSLTGYGTGWFEPFNSYRVSFNTIFVADPFYTLPFLICFLIALIAKNGSPQRANWNKAGLWISSCYLVFTIINHAYVYRLMENSFSEQKLAADKFVVTPTPLNNFLWMAYSHDKDGAYIGYYSVFDKKKTIAYQRVQRNDSLLIPFEKDESVKIFKQFSKGQYIISQENEAIYFNDIRFGQEGGWDDPGAPFVFKFNLNKKSDNKKAFSRTRFKTSFSAVFASLLNRVRGN